jgi:predicted 3-demethylubiquinone-9 3-methyltransferase (glyoxalase superfamily)
MEDNTMPRITSCLWFDDQAEDAANFYVSIFPNSKVTAVERYPMDTSEAGKKAGEVMTVTFELDGMPYMGLNGGPIFKFDEAISFVIDCDGQAEVDRYWDALLAGGGQESVCGWLKDKFGLSWQVVPRQLIELTTGPDKEKAARVFAAMMKMVKLDVAKLQAAAEES